MPGKKVMGNPHRRRNGGRGANSDAFLEKEKKPAPVRYAGSVRQIKGERTPE